MHCKQHLTRRPLRPTQRNAPTARPTQAQCFSTHTHTHTSSGCSTEAPVSAEKAPSQPVWLAKISPFSTAPVEEGLLNQYMIDRQSEGTVLEFLTSFDCSSNAGVDRCRNDRARPSLPRRSSTFRPKSWRKRKRYFAPIAVTYPARPAAHRHRTTMYVGSAVDRHPEAVSASSHCRQRTRSVWRPCAAKAICDAPF